MSTSTPSPLLPLPPCMFFFCVLIHNCCDHSYNIPVVLVLQVFDVKGDGHLDEPELRQVIQSAYPSIPDLDVSCLFKRVDVNHKGHVTFGTNKAGHLLYGDCH